MPEWHPPPPHQCFFGPLLRGLLPHTLAQILGRSASSDRGSELEGSGSHEVCGIVSDGMVQASRIMGGSVTICTRNAEQICDE
jgi:hypothetical protein